MDYLKKNQWKLYLHCGLLKSKVASYSLHAWSGAVHVVGVQWMAAEWIYLLENKVFLSQLSSLYSSASLRHSYRGLLTLNNGHLVLRTLLLSGCPDDRLILCEIRSELWATVPTDSTWHVTLLESLPTPLHNRKGPFLLWVWEASGMKTWVWRLGRVLMGREA